MTIRLHLALPAPALILLLSTTGCLSASHQIPKNELYALSQKPPETRGERVRVIQSLGGTDDPPAPAPAVQAGVSVAVVQPVWIGGTPYHGNVANARKEEAQAWLVVAAVVAGAMALTEGVRYDGWVKLHPMQPVHLWGPYGEYTWMPLANITPDVAAWASRAVVRQTEGPWQPLGRAPLNRQGLTYSLFFGGGEVPLLGADPQAGFLGRIQLGFFPIHQVGLQADIAFAWTDDNRGATIFDGRYSFEVDALPFSTGLFHAGAYGQIGFADLSDDGIQFDQTDTLFGGGALFQIALTTRLALTVRAGMVSTHDEALGELSGGVSIY